MSKQDRRFLLIGALCAQFSHLEFRLAQVIWSLLGINEKTGKLVTSGLDILPRVRMAIRLASHLNAKSAVKKALDKVRTELQNGIIDQRNLAVHGIHTVSDDGETMTLEVHRGGNANRQITISIRDLNALNKRIYDLSTYLDREVPDLSSIIAK